MSSLTSLKNTFEKELKNKLLMKTVGSQSEETVLFKAFKYFDLSNSNNCDRKTFIKAVLKIGITGFSDEDLSKVFSFYDTENSGIIDYRDFIGILYNNPSMMANPKKLNENYLNKNDINENNDDVYSVDDLLQLIRNEIFKKGIRCLISFENNFRALDDDNSQTVDFNSFCNSAEDFHFNLNFEDLKKLFQYFDKNETGRIDYDEFIRAIRGQMSENRKQLIENVFNTFNLNKNGYIHLNNLSRLFNAMGHPDVINGKKNENEIYKEFIDTFEGNHTYLNGDEAQFGNVDIDEFLDYYDSVSMFILKDADFANVIKGVWLNEYNNNNEDNSNYENKNYENDNKLKGKKVLNKKNDFDENYNNDISENNNNNNDAFELFKQYLQKLDDKTVLNLSREFKKIDENGNKTIDFNDFCRAIININLDIPKDVLKELFNDFDYDNSGIISYEEFISKILGKLNNRRESVVKAAFNKLDLDKSGIIELNEIKNFYCTKNNPKVLNGEMTEEELYKNFIETFVSHHNFFSGIRDKHVTYKEFLSYYTYISFNILNDEDFVDIVVAAWKLENMVEYINIQKNEDKKRQLQMEQNLEEKSETGRGKKNATSVRGGGAPYGVDRDPTDYSTSNYMNYDNTKLPDKKKVNNYINDNDYNNYNNNYNNYNDNNYNNYNNNYNNDINQMRNNLQPKRENLQLREGENALKILKNCIKERGTRGIMGMRRSFMIYDIDNTRLLSFVNFYKYINSFLIPLSRNQSAALFHLYDNKNKGEICYDDLISELCDNFNEKRKNIVLRAFSKIDNGRKGVVNMNIIRENFLPNGHPDVMTGKKNKEEVLVEFLDNFDYHFNLLNQGRNPDDEEVSVQEFVDFYRYISNSVESDEEFEMMISGVWGLNKSNTRKYY